MICDCTFPNNCMQCIESLQFDDFFQKEKLKDKILVGILLMKKWNVECQKKQ